MLKCYIVWIVTVRETNEFVTLVTSQDVLDTYLMRDDSAYFRIIEKVIIPRVESE